MKKLVVITGASSGFGRAVAIQLSALGHPLLLLARRLKPMEALALPNTLCRSVDVTDTNAFVEALKEAEAKFGKVDCLINNAGLMQLGSILDQDAQEWQNMYDLNVVALLKGTQLVAKDMKVAGSGTIINISSIAGRKSFPNHAAYCGTKFAVHAVSETLREELASSNVRVVVISPGAADTELISHTSNDEVIDNYKAWTSSIGGSMSAEAVADAIVYAYSAPQHVCIREIALAPTRQEP